MIAVTGASGKLGRLIVQGLLERVPAERVILVVRDPEKVADFAARGVSVRRADYSEPGSLGPALAGASKVLLVSASELGRRVPQHQAVIDAAKAEGVRLLGYTSILNADTTGIGLAGEHKATEAMILASGLPYVFLRNSWYMENYTGTLAPVLAHGVVLGAAGDGRVAPATRADFALAAVTVLTNEGHAGKAYELAGDQAFTLAEFAAAVAKWSGKPIAYKNMSEQDFAAALVSVGLPAPFAAALADGDVGIARGDLFSASGDLHRLIGRPTQTLEATLELLPRP